MLTNPENERLILEAWERSQPMTVAACYNRVIKGIPGLETYGKTTFYRLLRRKGLIDILNPAKKNSHPRPPLTSDEEARCVEYKRATRATTPACFQELRKEIPNLTKDALRKLYVKHGIARLANFKERPKSAKKARPFWAKDSAGQQRENPVRYMLASAKARARELGIDFDVVPEDLEWTGVCPVFGFPLVFGKGRATYASPSIDRIDNTKGYVKGNVIIVSMKVNQIKNSATPDEIIRVGEFYRSLPL